MNPRTIRAFLYLALLVVSAGLVIHWWPELVSLWIGKRWTFLVTIGLMALGTFVQARNFVEFMSDRATSGISGLVRIWAVSTLVNYVAPFQAGMGVRIYQLHRQGIAVSDSLIGTIRQSIASIFVSMLGVSVALLLIDTKSNAVYALVILSGLFAAFISRRVIVGWLGGCHWPIIAERKKWLLAAIQHMSLRGVSGVVIQYGIGTFLTLFVYKEFGANIEIGQALLIACAVYVSALVAVLPGNLGILEGIYAVSGHALGLSLQESAALALLLRTAQVASCLLLLLLPRMRSV